MSTEPLERRVDPDDGRIWTRISNAQYACSALQTVRVAIYDNPGSSATVQRWVDLHDWTTWELVS